MTARLEKTGIARHAHASQVEIRFAKKSDPVICMTGHGTTLTALIPSTAAPTKKIRKNP